MKDKKIQSAILQMTAENESDLKNDEQNDRQQ